MERTVQLPESGYLDIRNFSRLFDNMSESYKIFWFQAIVGQVHREFDRCLKEHVNSLDIQEKLYSKGLSEEQFSRRLEEIVYPVYHAAQNVGFGSWKMP